MLGYINGNFLQFKRYLAEELPELKLSPIQGTYLAWVDFGSLDLSNEELEKLLRDKCLISAVPGPAFGKAGEGFARFNIALPRNEMMKALERLKKGIRG